MSQMGEPQILQRGKNHLPHDIVLNIMTRLPVKSVTRFRFVCKSWDSSITTPYFISDHLNNSKNNDDDNVHVIHMPSWEHRRRIATWEARSAHPDTSIGPVDPSDTLVCTVGFGRTCDRISEVRIPFDFDSKCSEIVASCNGLLCFATFGGNVIYLWNPSIRMFKRLPDTKRLGKLDSDQLGFAYHSKNDDYEVVRISHSHLRIPEIVIEVYTLSSDSWKMFVIPLTAVISLRHKNKYIPAPLVSGALHWVGFNEGSHRTVILSFDIDSETLRQLALPTRSSYDGPFIGLFKGKLASSTLEHCGNSDFRYSIWMMMEYGVDESWNRFVVVPLERLPYWSVFTNYGPLTLCFLNLRVERSGFEFLLIDTEALHDKKDPDIKYPSYIATFMESLLLLDGANVVSY